MSRRALWAEIALILLLKITVLTCIWSFCFSHPVAKDLSVSKVAAHIVASGGSHV